MAVPSLDKVRSILPNPENKAKLITNWQNSKDLIKAMAQCHIENLQYAKKIAPLFKGKNDVETCKNVFDFLKYNVPYRIESGSAQKVKTLPRFIADSYSVSGGDPIGNDCKMYAVFCNTILNSLGIPTQYRFVSFKGTSPTHTYCVYPDQNLVIDAVLSTFDTEKPYKTKKDMSLYKMSGIVEEEASRKALDYSNLDTAINGFSLKNIVQKSTSAIKNAVKSIPAVTKKVVQGMKTMSLAIPRNAFLGLVALNVRGFATDIMKLVEKGSDLKWWLDLGGDRTKLKEVASAGAKRKRIFGIEGYDSELGKLGYIEEGMIGVEPVSTATALASATPVILALLKAVKENKLDTADLEKAVAEGSKNFKETTGKDITEIAFQKDAGKIVKQIATKVSDLKTPSLEVATKIAKAVVKNTTGITEAQITKETTSEPMVNTAKSTRSSDPVKADVKAPDTAPKQGIFESLTSSKFTPIAIGLGVGAVILFSMRKGKRR